MKLYNKKFEAAGYQYVPEEADAQSDTWRKYDSLYQKEICIYYRGDSDARFIAVQEKTFANGKWTSSSVNELNPIELDAINEFCQAKKFSSVIRWDEDNEVYVIKVGE